MACSQFPRILKKKKKKRRIDGGLLSQTFFFFSFFGLGSDRPFARPQADRRNSAPLLLSPPKKKKNGELSLGARERESSGASSKTKRRGREEKQRGKNIASNLSAKQKLAGFEWDILMQPQECVGKQLRRGRKLCQISSKFNFKGKFEGTVKKNSMFLS